MSGLFGNHCYLMEIKNFTEEGFELYKSDRQDYMTGYFSFGLPWLKLAICIFGILTNILNITVLTRPQLTSSINIQFAALEVVNLILYTTFFYEFAMFYNKEYVILFSEEISLLSTISYCLNNICICVSNWLTVSVGIWRFIAITYPFKAPTYCSKYRSKVVVASVLVMTIALWFYYFFSFECLLYVYEISKENGSALTLNVGLTGNWRSADDSRGFRSYLPIAVLLSTATPCSILVIVTLGLIFRLWKARKERMSIRKESLGVSKNKSDQNNDSGERRLTITLTAMIVMYFVTYLPDSVTSVLYWFYPQTYIQTLFICRIAWSRCFLLLGNSLTIFFYSVMSERLRIAYVKILRTLFCPCSRTNLQEGISSTVTSQTSIL